jgi:GntR family transcriptional repressor for pyruvate dehydrogenase complex
VLASPLLLLSDNLTMTDAAQRSGPRPTLDAQPIARRKTYELVADRLAGLIGDRSLRAGDQLPTERELTESFAVGRSSIREALRMLESQGVIMPASGGAFVVATPANPLHSSLRLLLSIDEVQIHEVFELRLMLECEAAALAATRRSSEHLEGMDRATEAMSVSLAQGESGSFIDADLRFHLAVAEAAGNRLLVHTMHAVREAIRLALSTVFPIPGSPVHAVEEHHAVRAAIADGDAGAAREAMRAHLVRVESDVDKGSPRGANG